MQTSCQSTLLPASQQRSTGVFTSRCPHTTKHTVPHVRLPRHVIRSQAAAGAGNTAREPNYDSVSFRQNTGASASTSAVIDVTDESQKQDRMEEVMDFLKGELATIFTTGAITRARYAADMKFEDPLVKYASLDGFAFNVRLLKSAFKIQFIVHDISINGPEEIRTRWSMVMKPRLPLQPQLVFSGSSYYTVEAVYGKIARQRDVWDAVQDNSSPSIEGIAHLIRQLTTLQITPDLDTPPYTVLKKTKEYEVRRYSSYLVAETDLPAGTRPAGGDGFNDLAGYIFGKNNRCKTAFTVTKIKLPCNTMCQVCEQRLIITKNECRKSKMEMTTPVISTGGQSGPDGDKMQFPMENKFGTDPDVLPLPDDSRVTRKMQEGGIVAAASFGGIPLDFQVTAADRTLRAALLLDGLKAQDGYQLARYNDPFTLPFLRRNEVLIALEDFELN